MNTLTKQQFQELAEFKAGLCISFYLPTHPVGQGGRDQVGQLILKNQMKQVAGEMLQKGFSEHAVTDFLDPLQRLSNDSRFWRDQNEGLAIFLTSDHFQHLHLPYQVPALTYVAYEFYLKPLAPLLSETVDFYLLSLNLQQVVLYRGNRDTWEEVLPTRPLPQSPEEVVGADFRPKFLGFHGSKVGGHQSATFHGQGEWQADEKEEITRFFRAVNESVIPELQAEPLPLLLAGLVHLTGLYRRVNTYPGLHDEQININPVELTVKDLHREAWKIMAPRLDQQRQELVDLVRQYRDTERTATDMQTIIPAAINGRIRALFLDEAEEVWGVYYPKNAKTVLHPAQQTGNASLTNLATIQVLLQGGQVFLTKKEDLPLSYAPANALFRY